MTTHIYTMGWWWWAGCGTGMADGADVTRAACKILHDAGLYTL